MRWFRVMLAKRRLRRAVRAVQESLDAIWVTNPALAAAIEEHSRDEGDD
ncbi:hypothetical protein [Salinibacterium sp. ZJ450]|nr:hypothetical protein [Salinibacterium sp. ZJ450]